jgi:hypothetical protein
MMANKAGRGGHAFFKRASATVMHAVLLFFSGTESPVGNGNNEFDSSVEKETTMGILSLHSINMSLSLLPETATLFLARSSLCDLH